jgi:chromosome segregation ATPase
MSIKPPQKNDAKVDRYLTANMSLSQKLSFYSQKLKEFQKIKGDHKNELQNLKSLKTSSVNVLQFKMDEMTKKMRNEITRLKQEESRHEESQVNESKRIQAQINFLKENNEQLTEVLDEFLARVVTLEKALGPLK